MFVVLAVAVATSLWVSSQFASRASFAEAAEGIRVGMPRPEVVAILGRPNSEHDRSNIFGNERFAPPESPVWLRHVYVRFGNTFVVDFDKDGGVVAARWIQ